jgi:hypothetical protein
MMTIEQEAHLTAIKAKFEREVDTKYRAGQKEHGGNLWLKSGILKNIKQETIDFNVYVEVLERQLLEVKDLLEQNKLDEAIVLVKAMLSETMEELISVN